MSDKVEKQGFKNTQNLIVLHTVQTKLCTDDTVFIESNGVEITKPEQRANGEKVMR